MPEVIMEYDLNETGKMINMRRKETIVRCEKCEQSHKDTIFNGLWCNGRLKNPNGFCEEGKGRVR